MNPASSATVGRHLLFAVVLAAGVVGSCKKEPRTTAPRRGAAATASGQAPQPTAGSATRPSAASQPALTQRSPGRSLLAEASLAELYLGGLFVDLGTPDQHKHTRGGWRSGWGPLKRGHGGETYAELRDPTAVLHLPEAAWQGVGEVALRVRSRVPSQRLVLVYAGEPLGEVALSSAWRVVRVAVTPKARRAAAQRNAAATPQLGLQSLRGPEQGPRADVDWVWLRAGSTDAGSLGPPALVPAGRRRGPLRLGQATRRALLAPTPRRFSFYDQLGPQAVLTFDYGAMQPTTFVVRAQQDGQPARELWRARAMPGAWRRARVDLAALAGPATRLDLVTAGPAGPAGWGEPELTVAVPARPRRTGPPATNVIVVVLDALRNDIFPFAERPGNVHAPTWARLAAEGTVFQHAYANTNWTKGSVSSILSGLYPLTHQITGLDEALSPKVPMVQERFKAAGLRTAGFTGNPFLQEKFGFVRGWDHYLSYPEAKADHPSQTWGDHAAVVARHERRHYVDALAWVKQHRRQRHFVYVHTMGSHAPYAAPLEEARRYAPDVQPLMKKGPRIAMALKHGKFALSALGDLAPQARTRVAAFYRAKTTVCDRFLGELVTGLERLGLLDSTLLVVTADHGEELFDHGYLGHRTALYEEQLHVPLILRYPPLVPAGLRVTEPVELVDLAPTLMEATGMTEHLAADGRSLLSLLRGERDTEVHTAIATHDSDGTGRAIRVGHYKLMVIEPSLASGPAAPAPVRPGAPPGPRPGPRAAGSPRLRPGVELYDLADDPGEQRNRAHDLPIARRFAEIHLSQALAVPRKSLRTQGLGAPERFQTVKSTIDPATRRQLEALGYIGD